MYEHHKELAVSSILTETTVSKRIFFSESRPLDEVGVDLRSIHIKNIFLQGSFGIGVGDRMDKETTMPACLLRMSVVLLHWLCVCPVKDVAACSFLTLGM